MAGFEVITEDKTPSRSGAQRRAMVLTTLLKIGFRRPKTVRAVLAGARILRAKVVLEWLEPGCGTPVRRDGRGQGIGPRHPGNSHTFLDVLPECFCKSL